MLTQIDFYDKDTVKNILGCLSVKPDRIVFIYDSEIKDKNRFVCLESCFKKHLPNIIFEIRPVDINDVIMIYKTVIDVIDTYSRDGRCVMDITGGSELMTVAGAKAAIETKTKMLYSDIIEGRIINVEDKADFVPAETLTLDDYVEAKCAVFIGNSHDAPDESRFGAILDMCEYIFSHLKEWRVTCSYIQQAMASTPKSDVDLRSVLYFKTKGGHKVSPDIKMLEKFQELGFIKDLYVSEKHIVFSFKSEKYKSYLINFGVWLELFVYIHAIKTGEFSDVRLGAMVDWDIFDDKSVPGNEIDVVFTDASMPVFVSCKLTEATTSAINELVIERKRIGGWFSKAIIVTFSNDKKENSGVYKRAKELGVEMLDKNDIISGEFGKRLVSAVREHDLVSLKWKKF